METFADSPGPLPAQELSHLSPLRRLPVNPVFARGHIDFFMAAKTQQKNKRWAKRGETAPPAAIAALRRIAPAHVPDAARAALAKGGDAQKAKAEVTR